MEIEFTSEVFREGKLYVAYARELDLSSCGETPRKAQRNRCACQGLARSPAGCWHAYLNWTADLLQAIAQADRCETLDANGVLSHHNFVAANGGSDKDCPMRRPSDRGSLGMVAGKPACDSRSA